MKVNTLLFISDFTTHLNKLQENDSTKSDGMCCNISHPLPDTMMYAFDFLGF